MSAARKRALLERGYFPVQLPPAFVTSGLAAAHGVVGQAWNQKQMPSNAPDRFSVARSSYSRRETSIVNPVSFLSLVETLDNYWGQIQRHFSRSSLSFSRPKLDPGLRAIRINKLSDLHEKRILASSGYKYVLVTDLSRFFHTIYTHSIPWALHGKVIAKANKRSSAYFGNAIDVGCMALQEFQTIGLPVGPDTSHVIAEIVATAIDIELKRRLGAPIAGFRYVDDFYLFFNDRSEAERALAEVIKIAAIYELQINAQKTKVMEARQLIEDSWKYKVKGLQISSSIAKQKDDLHQFFETLFALERSFKDESVVKYGLRRLSSHIVKRQNWGACESYLLQCGFSFPNCMQVVASLLATYNRHGYLLSRNSIQTFCNSVIEHHSPLDNHSEVAWALWMLIELNLRLHRTAVNALQGLSNSSCVLLALSLLTPMQRRKFAAAAGLQALATAKELYGTNWLLVYEGGRRGWLGNASAAFISADPHFAELLSRNVAFYDDQARLPPIFSLRQNVVGLSGSIFESDDEIEEYFEFDEADEEYFDSEEEQDGEEDEDEEEGEGDDDEDENDVNPDQDELDFFG